MATSAPLEQTRAQMAAAFARELGFWPRAHSHDPGEARLGKWLDAARQSGLPPEPAAALDRVTGAGDWRQAPVRHRPTAASVHADQTCELAVWRLRHGRLPRSGPSAQPLERDLAAFAARHPGLAAPRPDEIRQHSTQLLGRLAALELALFDGLALEPDLHTWLSPLREEDLAPSALRALDTLASEWRTIRAKVERPRPQPFGRPPDEARFKERALELRTFAVRHGRLPRQGSHDSAERSTYAWLVTQRQRLAHGARALSDERIEMLDRLVPGWARGARHLGSSSARHAPRTDDPALTSTLGGRPPDEKRFRERAGELQAFAEHHGRLPRAGSIDPGERSAWNWLTAQRRALRHCAPSMGPERQALLDHLVPGWRPRRPAPPAPAFNTGLAQGHAIAVSSGTEC